MTSTFVSRGSFAWLAWHNLTSTFVLRGRRGTYGTGWRAWAGFSRPGHRGTFAWQVWHNLTSTFVLPGRRGTISHPPSFCVAGMALVAPGRALGLVLVARDAAALCVAAFCVEGVALMALGGEVWAGFSRPGRRGTFAWQVWHNLTSTFVLRGRCGTCGTGWRAWAGFSQPGRRATLRGRRGTWWHRRAFHVAGVAQSHIHLCFAWQVWHLWHWVARLGCVTPMSHSPWFHRPSHTHLYHTPSVTYHLCHTPTVSMCCHTPSFIQSLLTILSRTSLSHTILPPPASHHPLHTHFVTYHLSHTTLSHAVFDILSFTSRFGSSKSEWSRKPMFT